MFIEKKLEEITKYIFIEDVPERADLIFVFGTKFWEKSLEKSVELYKRGIASKIIFSGGINEDTKINESHVMRDAAVKLGVNKDDLIIEDKSTNTLENVLFSRELLDNKLGLSKIKTIAAVVKNYHARRSLMTLKKHFPKHISFKAIPYSLFDFDKNNWYLSEKGKEKVLGEFEKIKKYLKKGDIEEI